MGAFVFLLLLHNPFAFFPGYVSVSDQPINTLNLSDVPMTEVTMADVASGRP